MTKIELGIAGYEGDLQVWYSVFITLPEYPKGDELEEAVEAFQKTPEWRDEWYHRSIAGYFLINIEEDYDS